jgi:hypothetical protein
MIDQLELLALKSIALKDPEYFNRKVCRYYSEKFHTPLAEVYKLPWVFVFTNYIEHIIENNNTKENVYDLCVEIFYPEKKRVTSSLGEFDSEEEEIQAWIKKIEEEEEEKRQNAKQNDKTKEEIKEPEIELKQSDFSHLEEEMNED